METQRKDIKNLLYVNAKDIYVEQCLLLAWISEFLKSMAVKCCRLPLHRDILKFFVFQCTALHCCVIVTVMVDLGLGAKICGLALRLQVLGLEAKSLALALEGRPWHKLI